MLKAQRNKAHFTFLMIFMGVVGCNGRPTYDIHIYDLESFCDGHMTSRFSFDPEPENVKVQVEADFKVAAARDGLSLRVEKRYAGADIFVDFKCGATCKFAPSNYQGECVCPAACHTDKCVANLKLRGYRYPSHGPGYEDPIAKQTEDYWLDEQPNKAASKK